MSNPLVSIVMPVFNSEKFVGEAVESLLSQTFKDFELIIVDDGSTDKSAEIISTFQDSRIRILSNLKNRGIVFSRNRGLKDIRGKFYAPFDSDDVARPDKFEKQIDFLNKNPEFAMIGSWANLIDEHGEKLPKKWKLKAKPEHIPPIMLFRNYFVHSSILVRKEFIENIVYEDGFDVVEDYKFCADLAFGSRVVNYPDYLLKYRFHSKSAMRKDRQRMRNQDIKIYRYLFDKLEIKLSESDLNSIFALKGERNTGALDELIDIEKFLIRIIRQNNQLQLFNHKELEKTVANRWLKACYLARGQHLKMLPVVARSPITSLTFNI